MIKKLTKLTDVQVGDYFPVSDPSVSTPLLTIVDKIILEHNVFCYKFDYKSVNGYLMGNVREENLKQVVLLRKTNTGLEILAGEEAYEELTRPKEKGKEISEKLLGALARVCLKKGEDYDDM